MLTLTSISRVYQKKTGSDRYSKYEDLKVHVLVNKLAFFYLIIGNFYLLCVSDLIVITIRTGPRCIASKSEVMGKELTY